MNAPAAAHADWFTEALASFARIAITGGPKVGKTTICERVNGRPVIHGDDYMHLGWSESSQKLSDVVNSIHGPCVVEGVQVPRALRKGMRVDVVIWLERHGRYERAGHDGMATGAWNILGQWRQLNARVPVIIQTGLSLRNALPKQEFP